MSRRIGIAVLFAFALQLSGWEEAARPVFTGSWQLDPAKSKTEIKDPLVWKIEHKMADIGIEEISAGKTLINAKCSVGKSCEFDDNGKKVSAMTYFLDATMVQIRTSADNSSVIKRQLTMNEDGSLGVELITMVPSEKTETLVFTKQKTAAVAKPSPAKH